MTISSPGDLRLLCRYHDIGMLASPEELELIQLDPAREKIACPMHHMATGHRIARSISEISRIADAILAHHEWWDGMGYPNQLEGEKIPFVSRLVSLLDTMDALLRLRPEGGRFTPERVIASIRASAGKQFDPVMAELVVEQLQKNPPDFIENMED